MPRVDRHIVHHLWGGATRCNVVFLLAVACDTAHIVRPRCRQLVVGVYFTAYLFDEGATLVLRLRLDDRARVCDDQLRGGRTFDDIELIILFVQSLVRCEAHLVVFSAQEGGRTAIVLRRSLLIILHDRGGATLEHVLRLRLTYLLLLCNASVM